MALILVTGSSTGLGQLAAASLIRLGHDVVAHMRTTPTRPDLSKIRGASEVFTGDLARPDHVQTLAEEANSLGRFDAVIHNAGVFSGPDVFAVNLLAPYILSAVMRPPARSIFLSSSMHRSGSADLEAIHFDQPSVGSYEDSKLYVTALAMIVAKQLPETLSHAVDPGWVPTRMGGPDASDSLEEGHRTQEWLAAAPAAAIEPRTGGYWYHRRLDSPSPLVHDLGFQLLLERKLMIHTGLALTPERAGLLRSHS